MPQMNFDLEDGQEPVSFALSKADGERFMAFMADCNDAIKERQELLDQQGAHLDRIEQLEQDLLDQRYKHQRVCKSAGDLLKLVEFREQELGRQRRLSVVKQTLKEFGPEGEPS